MKPKLYLFLPLLAAMVAAMQVNPKRTKANLNALTSGGKAHIEVLDAHHAGGSTSRMATAIEVGSSQVKAGAKSTLWLLNEDGAYIKALPGALNLPVSWEGYDSLIVELYADEPIDVELSVVGHRSRLNKEVSLDENGTLRRLALPLHELPLVSHGNSVYAPNYIAIQAEAETYPAQVHIADMYLHGMTDWRSRPVIDAFGQRIDAQWPGKVKADNDLAHQLIEERKDISHKGHRPTEKRLHKLHHQQGGCFTIMQQDGWYTFKAPDKQPFWSLGVTGVRPKSSTNLSDVTKVKGREQIFSHLPTEVPQAWQDPEHVSFYARNAIRKYGSLAGWRTMAETRLPSFGINTLGNWSDTLMFAKARIPYTVALSTLGGKLDRYRLVHNFPDIYKPGFEKALDSAWAHVARLKDQHMLIGYFVDNEQHWQDMRLLDAPASSPLRLEWLRLVKKKYKDLAKLNAAAKTRFASFEEVRQLRQDKMPAVLAPIYRELELDYAEDYFRLVRKKLESLDDRHLYLGCRFTKRLISEDLARIVSRYADVVTVNIYDSIPTLARQWHELTRKPILVGEFHFPQAGPRQVLPTYQAFSMEDRKRMTIQYIKECATTPGVIGCHWYQYADQPLTGRGNDGENQIVGLVDVTDKPHPELRDAFRIAADSLPHWRPGLK